jgi:hypothetical protein
MSVILLIAVALLVATIMQDENTVSIPSNASLWLSNDDNVCTDAPHLLFPDNLGLIKIDARWMEKDE